MPENTPTATGFKNRIIEAVPGINERYAQRLAYRTKRRMDWATRWVDAPVETVYEEGLRILGILPDITARDAVRNIEAVSA